MSSTKTSHRSKLLRKPRGMSEKSAGPTASIPDEELGRRLRIARESARINRRQASEIIGVPESSLASVERGRSRAGFESLKQLASTYAIPVESLLRPQAVFTELLPRFRKLQAATDRHTMSATNLLNRLVAVEIELEKALNQRMKQHYPPALGLPRGNVREVAEQAAEETRQYLRLRSSPVADFVTLLAERMKIRIYQRPLSAHVSGLYAYSEETGACILVNASHPIERQRQSTAHELGHFVSTRDDPEILTRYEKYQSTEEQFADYFGRYFLAPTPLVEEEFDRVVGNDDRVRRRHVIVLANHFGISREAMVRRLESIGLVESGTWDWFRDNGGITIDHVLEVLKEDYRSHYNAASCAIPARMVPLIQSALANKLYTEEQLSNLLQVSSEVLLRVVNEASAVK